MVVRGPSTGNFRAVVVGGALGWLLDWGVAEKPYGLWTSVEVVGSG